MWQEFNIKTFVAETIVYRDGVYCPDLSTISDGAINTKYDKPVHIIYVGEIAGKNDLNIDLNADLQNVFVSVNVKNKKPAFLNIYIKNTGKNSEIRGHVMLENFSNLTFECDARHLRENTGILIQTKLRAHADSMTKLSGTANIEKNCNGCTSDISFSALADRNAKIEFLPAQRISAVPTRADHGAALYRPTDNQIEFLRQSGLSSSEIVCVTSEAFMNDFNLF